MDSFGKCRAVFIFHLAGKLQIARGVESDPAYLSGIMRVLARVNLDDL